MGYQETWFYIKPQSQFDKMVQQYDTLNRQGRYDELVTGPLSVITLKKPMDNIPADTKLLWVCGERCFQNQSAILGQGFTNLLRRVKVLNLDKILVPNDERLNGIDFSKSTPSENDFLKRECFKSYAASLSPQQRMSEQMSDAKQAAKQRQTAASKDQNHHENTL